MKNKLRVCRRSPSSSPKPMIFLTSDSFETTSSIIYDEPPFMHRDNIGRSCSSVSPNISNFNSEKKSKIMIPPNSKNNFQSHRNKKLDYDSRKSYFLPWHRLEQDCEKAAAIMLQFNQKNKIKQSQFQTETLIEMNLSDNENNFQREQKEIEKKVIKEDVPIVEFSPAIQFISSTRAPSVNSEVIKEPDIDSLGENTEETVEIGSKLSKILKPMQSSSVFTPDVTNSEELNKFKYVSQNNEFNKKNFKNIINNENSFIEAAPPMYIFIAPPVSSLNELSPEIQGNQNFMNQNKLQYEKKVNINCDQKGKFLNDSYNIEPCLKTPTVESTLYLPSTPQLKKRKILTPLNSESKELPLYSTETFSTSNSTNMGKGVNKYNECHFPNTPNKGFVSNVSSPSRSKDAIIVSWRGLSAYYKRKGLITPVLPLLLRRDEV